MTTEFFSRRRALFLAASAAALLAAPAQAQTTPADTSVEGIVVVGVRASLNDALKTKRDETAVVDSIVAEDIAQFPQSNLAEAIQRISGVQARRDFAGGIGNEVSVRGMPPEFTQVLINGQSAPSGAESRVFNFNALPAELFRRVDVFKSSTASMDEGGIGGTISLETLKPLDLRGRRGVATLGANYNDITGKTSPNGTLTLGKTWNGRTGVILGLAYSEFAAASQSYDAVRWTRRNFDTNGDGTIDQRNVFLFDLPRLVNEQQKVDRFSGTATFQHRFSDKAEIALDALYVDAGRRQDRLTPIWFFDGATGLVSMDVRDGVAEAAEFTNVRYRSENNTDDTDTKTYKLGATLELDLAGWSIKPFVSGTKSTSEVESWRFFADRRSRAAYDIRQDDDYFTIDVPYDIADPTGMTMSEARHNTGEVKDEEIAGGFDAKRRLNDILRLDTGFKLRDRSKSRQRFARTITGLTESFAPFAAIKDDFLSDHGDMHAFAYTDFGKSIAFYRDRLDLASAEEINNFYEVDERTTAGYASLRYEWGRVRGDAGLRVARTEVTSVGSERLRPANVYSQREVESAYTDVLPNFNLRFAATPRLLLRAAAAKTLTRPSLADLAAYREINESNRTISARNPDLDPTRANQYDLAVEWYFAGESLLSAGYFYKDVDGFIANRTEQVTLNGVAYTQTIPVNVNAAKIEGLEFTYQQPFTFLPGPFNGLGIMANYTYTDASFRDLTGAGQAVTYALPNNSKHSYNLVLYYENKRFSVRAAHNFKGKFLREVPNEQDGLKYRDDYGQTDLSARLNVNDRTSLTLDVQNLFDSVQEEYVFEDRLTDGTFTTGRTVQFGLRTRF